MDGYEYIDGEYRPVFDEEELKQQQEIYRDKRKGRDEEGGETAKKRKKNQDSGIYIENLPRDTTPDELEEVFSKYGLIAEDLEGKKRVKLYMEGDEIKGDALVIYHRPESVTLAVQMMDDRELRLGETEHGRIKVQVADRSYKGNKEDTKQPKKEYSQTEKNQMTKKLKDMNKKIDVWDDDEVVQPQHHHQHRKEKSKAVILKHMFTLKELEENDTAELDIKEDVRDECEEKIGPVTSVTLYDLEPQGIIRVKFETNAQAEQCISMMNGRYFDGQTVEAHLMHNNERYKKSKKAANDVDSEEDEARAEKFGKWLES